MEELVSYKESSFTTKSSTAWKSKKIKRCLFSIFLEIHFAISQLASIQKILFLITWSFTVAGELMLRSKNLCCVYSIEEARHILNMYPVTTYVRVYSTCHLWQLPLILRLSSSQ